MFTLTLTLFTLGLLCLLIGAAHQARRTLPAPAAGWRDGDVLSRRRSVVDRVHAGDYTPGELRVWADQCRELEMHQSAVLLMDLAARREVEERLFAEQLRHRRDLGHVRAVARVAGL